MKRLQRSATRRGLSKIMNNVSEETSATNQKKEEKWNAIPELPDKESEENLIEKAKHLKKMCRNSRPDEREVQKLIAYIYPIR